MPTYVTIPESSAVEIVTDTFGGYNHNLKISDGEFFDMKKKITVAVAVILAWATEIRAASLQPANSHRYTA